MSILPGKTRDNTMMQIDGGASLSMGDAGAPCAFVDIRLFKASPGDAKSRFVRAITDILKERLGVDPARVYVNLIELPDWGARGTDGVNTADRKAARYLK